MTAATAWKVKKSFTIREDYAQKLNNYKNKSKIVNEALRMYFARSVFLKDKEQEFFENFEFEDFSNEELQVATEKLGKIANKLDELWF